MSLLLSWWVVFLLNDVVYTVNLSAVLLVLLWLSSTVNRFFACFFFISLSETMAMAFTASSQVDLLELSTYIFPCIADWSFSFQFCAVWLAQKALCFVLPGWERSICATTNVEWKYSPGAQRERLGMDFLPWTLEIISYKINLKWSWSEVLKKISFSCWKWS